MSGRGGRHRGNDDRGARRQRLRRRALGLATKEAVLIVCEGRETEPNYFRALYQEQAVRDRFHIVVKKGEGLSPLVAVKKAASLKHQGEYDAVYCVADVEGPAQRGEVDKALILARKNGITLILSNPCFEVWVLAHFGRTSRSFADADAVVAAVRRHTPDYRKNDEAIYRRLKDRTTAAIANAQAVRQTDHHDRPVQDCNSCTEVDKLVSYLLTPAH